MPKLKRPPKLSRHKASGQAYVTWQHKRHYLGEYGSEEASQNYARFIGDLVNLTPSDSEPQSEAPTVGWITIVELCAAFLTFAEGWYRKDGKPTTQMGHVKGHIKILVDHFGKLPVNEFAPKRLKMLQSSLVGEGGSRVGVNARIAGIKRIFRWGESEELVPRGTSHALATVRGLSKGRTVARECAPVLPVDDATVDTTLPCMPVVARKSAREPKSERADSPTCGMVHERQLQPSHCPGSPKGEQAPAEECQRW